MKARALDCIQSVALPPRDVHLLLIWITYLLARAKHEFVAHRFNKYKCQFIIMDAEVYF